MLNSFRQYGKVINIREIVCNDRLENLEIHCVVMNGKRLDCENAVMMNGKEFVFRFGGFQNILGPHIYDGSSYPFENDVRCDLMYAPAKDSPHNILHELNDDCLLKIFNKYDTQNLYNMASICQRFNDVAKRTFNSRYRRQSFSPIYDLRSIWPKLALFHIEIFLRVFGSGVRILCLGRRRAYSRIPSSNLNKQIVLRMCLKHCPRIETLNMRGARWNACLEEDIRRLWPQLKEIELDLEQCSIGDLFIGDFPMEKLEIRCSSDWETVVIKMPKLIELSLKADLYCMTERPLKQILSENPQLRKVKFEGFIFTIAGLELLPRYLPNCEEITFVSCKVDLKNPATLTERSEFKSLTTLHIGRGCRLPTGQILTSAVHVKTLSLPKGVNDSFVLQYIIPLRQLETITFSGDLPDINMYRLTRRLDNLSEIIFKPTLTTADAIKKLLRQIVQPLDLSIRIETKYLDENVGKNDCDEITDLLQSCPGIKLMVVIARISSKVSNFCFSDSIFTPL